MSIQNQNAFTKIADSGRLDEYSFHMITRNPRDRLIAYYWNWFVRLDENYVDTLGVKNRHFRLLANRAPPGDYSKILAAGPIGRRNVEVFDLFLESVPTIWPLDEHLWPQHLAYSDSKIDRGRIRLWDVNDLPAFLSYCQMRSDLHLNKSDIDNRQSYHTETLRRIASTVYRRDFLDLGYQL